MKTREWARRMLYGAAMAGVLVVGASAQAGKPGARLAEAASLWGDSNRPAFAIVALTEDFQLPGIDNPNGGELNNADTYGSPVLIVNIGSFEAGDSIETTRFLPAGEVFVPEIPMPPEIHPETGLPYDDLPLNQLTILGSFRTIGPDPTIHMMTPYAGAIDPAAQEAFFNASTMLDDFIASLSDGVTTRFPTTFELAAWVYENQGTAGASFASIRDALFAKPEFEPPLRLTTDIQAIAVASEGTLFPHDPFADGLFRYELVLTLDGEGGGNLVADACLPIITDIKPGNAQNTVNLGSEGVVTIAAISTATFNAATELDPASVSAVMLDDRGRPLSGSYVPALRWKYMDADADGDTDIVFKFDTDELAAIAAYIPAAEWTAIINFRGRTYAGMTVLSSDSIRVVPPTK